jgi:putative ABC transport system permease protein
LAVLRPGGRKARLSPGQSIVIAHGAGNTSFSQHDNLPFKVVGILAPTGTPIDRTIMCRWPASRRSIGWDTGRHSKNVTPEQAMAQDLTPKTITAFMVGLSNRILAFQLQRSVNTYRGEPLMAILPGAALQELWSLMSVAETALSVIAGFVVVAGLIGMLTTLLAGLNERRRELAILRSLGAAPPTSSCCWRWRRWRSPRPASPSGWPCSISVRGLPALAAQPLWPAMSLGLPSAYEWQLLGLVWLAGMVIGLLPAARAYRYSLSDGMSIRVCPTPIKEKDR